MPWQDDVATLLLEDLDNLHVSERRTRILLAKEVYDSAVDSVADETEQTNATTNSGVLAAAAAGYADAVADANTVLAALGLGTQAEVTSANNWEDDVAAFLLASIDTLDVSARRARLLLVQSVYDSAVISETGDAPRVSAAGTSSTTLEDAADGYQDAVTNIATINTTLGIT